MNIAPRSVFITGCSRGIGLEIVKQLLKMESPPKHLFANYRKDPDGLKDLNTRYDNLHLIDMDVTNYSALPEVVRQVDHLVGEDGLNLLINNAVIQPANSDLYSVTPEVMRTAYEVNCIAPLFISRAFLPLLERAVSSVTDKDKSSVKSVHKAAIIQLQTGGASIEENRTGGSYAYRSSKTAQNQCMRSMSVDLVDRGILSLSMVPCTDTDDVSIEIFVCWMLETLHNLEDKDHGAFLRCNNTSVPW